MNIELGMLNDGGVILVSDSSLPYLVRCVEYYCDQCLIMLIYDDNESNDELMHYEVSSCMTEQIKRSPDIAIYSLFPDHEPIGYKVPLIKIGDIY